MAAKPAKKNQPAPLDVWQVARPGIALLVLIVIAYLPALRGDFIWDDDFHVTKCEPLRSLAGLGRIWFEPGATQQFYPLTWTSFWIDFHLWGLNPFFYHAENILLHSINAILVWRILQRLQVPGSWFAAALFALHPVNVESVAWIAERKNMLSGLFFLLCVRAAIEFWLVVPAAPALVPGEKAKSSANSYGAWKYYWFALGFFICALLCKTVTAVLPGVVLLLIWWKRGRWRWKDWLLVLPWLATGVAMAFITASIEHRYVLEAANGDEWKLQLPEKFIIAGRAVWFYLGKLCWPHPLVFIYPRWALHPSVPLAYFPLAAVLAVCALLWWKRHAWGRAPLFVAGYFIAVLFPAIGFFNIFPFRYSFVADHFQYLAAIGPIALAAAGSVSLIARARNAKLKPVVIGVVLASYALLTWRQTGVYRNLEVLWNNTIAHNPSCWMAYDNLGLYLTENKRFSEAEPNYRTAIKIRPNDHIAYFDLGLQAAIQGNLNDATENFQKTLELCPTFAKAHYQMANVLVRQGKLPAAISEYRAALQALPDLVLGHFNLANALAENGETDAAIEEYKRTLAQQADYVPAYVGLGHTLSAKGDVEGAINQYRKALQIAPNSVEALAALGNALVAQGKLDDAVGCYRSALQVDPNSAILHFNLSVALSRLGNNADAEAERAEARRLQGRGAPML